MADSTKKVTDNLRNRWLNRIKVAFEAEEVLQTAAGTIYIPTVDQNGDDRWVKISVIISKAGEGDSGYDLAEEYKLKLEAAAERARKASEKAEKAKAKREAKE